MSEKREAILATAIKLFNQYGFGRVGIDRIIAESDVAKMTFYHYFGSKGNLIQECLIEVDSRMRQQVKEFVTASEKSGQGKLEGILNWYDNWFRSENFYGSLFIKAVNEFPTHDDILQIAMNNHQWLMTMIYEALPNEQVAKALITMLNGAIVHQAVYKDNIALNLIRQTFAEGDYEA